MKTAAVILLVLMVFIWAFWFFWMMILGGTTNNAENKAFRDKLTTTLKHITAIDILYTIIAILVAVVALIRG